MLHLLEILTPRNEHFLTSSIILFFICRSNRIPSFDITDDSVLNNNDELDVLMYLNSKADNFSKILLNICSAFEEIIIG